MRNRALLVTVGAATLTGTLLVAHPAAADAGPRCGDTVTRDVVLTHDLNCTGDGLVIDPTAGPVTIDLAGHTLRGAGTGVGITRSPVMEARNVEVRNGVISGFDAGVSLVHAFGDTRLFAVQLTGDRTGLDARASTYHVVASTFRDNTIGLFQSRSNVGYVDATLFVGNGTGANLYDAETHLSHDLFSANEVGIRADSTGLQLRASRFSDGGIGIDSVSNLGFRNLLENNSFVRLGLGVRYVGATDNVLVTGNDFVGNAASGLVLDRVSSGNASWEIVGNRFLRNGFAPGGYTSPVGAALRAGLWVRNGGPITGNVAIGNAGFGIEAYDSVDGGGNVATANGSGSEQCLGVVCLPSRALGLP